MSKVRHSVCSTLNNLLVRDWSCLLQMSYGLTCNKTQHKSTGNKTQMCTYRAHLLLPVYSWTRGSTSWRGGSIGWAGGKTLGSTIWAGGSTSWEGGSTSCEGGSISWTGGDGGRLGGMVSSALKDLMWVGIYLKKKAIIIYGTFMNLLFRV